MGEKRHKPRHILIKFLNSVIKKKKSYKLLDRIKYKKQQPNRLFSFAIL